MFFYKIKGTGLAYKTTIAVCVFLLVICLQGLAVWSDMHGWPRQGTYRSVFGIITLGVQIFFFFLPRRYLLQIILGLVGLIASFALPGIIAQHLYEEHQKFIVENMVMDHVSDEFLTTSAGNAIGVRFKFKIRFPDSENLSVYPVIREPFGYYATSHDLIKASKPYQGSNFRIVKRTIYPLTIDYKNINDLPNQPKLPVPELLPDSGLQFEKSTDYELEFDLLPSALKRSFKTGSQYCWIPKPQPVGNSEWIKISADDAAEKHLEFFIMGTQYGSYSRSEQLTQNSYDIVKLYAAAQNEHYPECSPEEAGSIF